MKCKLTDRASFGKLELEALTTLSALAAEAAGCFAGGLPTFAEEAAGGAFDFGSLGYSLVLNASASEETFRTLTTFGEEAAGGAFDFELGCGLHSFGCILGLDHAPMQEFAGRAFVSHGRSNNADEEGESRRDLHGACVC